jgi:hypothetical protein
MHYFRGGLPYMFKHGLLLSSACLLQLVLGACGSLSAATDAGPNPTLDSSSTMPPESYTCLGEGCVCSGADCTPIDGGCTGADCECTLPSCEPGAPPPDAAVRDAGGAFDLSGDALVLGVDLGVEVEVDADIVDASGEGERVRDGGVGMLCRSTPVPDAGTPPPCTEPAPGGCSTSTTYNPLLYWRFESAAPLADSAPGGTHALRQLGSAPAGVQFTATGGAAGGYARVTPEGNGANATAPSTLGAPSVTLEFFARLRPETMRSSRIMLFRSVGTFQFELLWSSLRVDAGGKRFEIPLDGMGRRSWPYYADGQWHHFALRLEVSGSVNRATLYVDGQAPEGFDFPAAAMSSLATPSTFSLGYRDVSPPNLRTVTDIDLDEVAYFGSALPKTLIHRHFVEGRAGAAYSATDNCMPTACAAAVTNTALDPNDYQPGWSDTDVYANSIEPLTQLESFAAPRYRQGHTLPPVSMAWMGGPNYMGGFLYETTSQAQAVTTSVAIQEELCETFSAGLSLEALKSSYNATSPAATNFADNFVRLANSHPECAAAVKTFWSGNVDDAANYMAGTNITSPTTPLSKWTADGAAVRPRLVALGNALTRPLDVIWENGETGVDRFQHASMAQVTANASVSADFMASGLSLPDYKAARVNAARTAYRDAMLSSPSMLPVNVQSTPFSYYSVDGHPSFYPPYSTMRTIQTPIADGSNLTARRPSTEFYTQFPGLWRVNASGVPHGWDYVQWSMPVNIAAGDRLMWPYVAAGWRFREQSNIRPGQWLGFLKALAVAGAETFVPGYFVIPESGFGGATDAPCRDITVGATTRCYYVQNPDNYAWQAVTPIYAHAVTSRYESILKDTASQFLLETWPSNPQTLVAVRKLGKQFVIAASLQVENNTLAQRQLGEAMTDVALDLDDNPSTAPVNVRIRARRQGSVYVYDGTSAATPTMTQLDTWHEASHPMRWSPDLAFEAEMNDGQTNASGNTWVTRTERPSSAAVGDYSTFTTRMQLSGAANSWTAAQFGSAPRLTFRANPRQTRDYAVWVRARLQSATAPVGSVRVRVDGGTVRTLGCVTGTSWKWVRLDCGTPAADPARVTLTAGQHTLEVSPGNTQVLIDRVLLTTAAGCIGEASDICGGCN